MDSLYCDSERNVDFDASRLEIVLGLNMQESTVLRMASYTFARTECRETYLGIGNQTTSRIMECICIVHVG